MAAGRTWCCVGGNYGGTVGCAAQAGSRTELHFDQPGRDVCSAPVRVGDSMRKAAAYVWGYMTGCRIGYRQAALLTPNVIRRVGNAVKGGNLSLCFMGFIPEG